MVRAVAATAYGGADTIELIEVDSTTPAEGEVTVAVRAAALNPFDLKTIAGAMGTDPAALPLRLGSEAAGIVTAVGPDAVGLEGEPLAVGDAVFGHRIRGAAADEVTVKASLLIRVPEGVSFPEAAALLAVGTTAVHALEAVGVGAGDTVLIHAASGGVGTMAAQLAILRGARVIGTASPRNHDDLAALGVEPVAYGDGLLDRVRALAPEGVSAAIDAAGTEEALDVSLELVADPSRIVTLVNFGPALAAGAQAIGGGPGADSGTEIRNAARLTLAQLLGENRIWVDVARTFPLAEAREAYAFLATGHPGGKVVLTA